MPRNIPSSSPVRVRFRLWPLAGVAWGLAVSLFLAPSGVVTAAAPQDPSNGDTLFWDGGTTASWTSSSFVWYDTNLHALVTLGDLSGNQGKTFSYTFNPGTVANSTTAPTAMTIGSDTSSPSIGVLGVNALTYNDGFNATNTMSVGSGHTNGIAESLAFANGWSINNNATSGAVTFNTVQFSSVLYFSLSGAGTIATPNANASVVINSSLTGSGASITKTGAGTLALAGTQSDYSGGTTVNGGTLLIAGGSNVASVTGSGAVTVNTGATLAGNGVAISNTTIAANATLSPGTGANGVGILALGTSGIGAGLTVNGAYRVDIVGGGTAAGTNFDQVSVTGLLTFNPISSTLVLGSVNRAGLALDQTFFLVLNDGVDPVAGTFNGLIEGATVPDAFGDTFRISYLANGDNGALGNDVALTVLSVPEPSAVVGCLLGVAGLAGAFSRRKLRSNTVPAA